MARNVTFEVFQDRQGKHRWRIKRGNSKVLDASTEGFAGGPWGAVRNFLKTRSALNLVTPPMLAAATKR